jgi:RNA-binding protein
MLNSKQRAHLRSMANTLETIVQIGRAGITDNIIMQAREALLARELIKLRVIDGSPITAKEAAQELSETLAADVVQVIGTRFVIYRVNPEKPVIKP